MADCDCPEATDIQSQSSIFSSCQKLMKKREANQPLVSTEKKLLRCEDNEQNKHHIQPPIEYPWILFNRQAFQCRKKGYICCTTSTLYKDCFTLFPDNLSASRALSCCYGWLIYLDGHLGEEVFLWNPVISKLIKLPLLELPVKGEKIHKAVLLSPGDRTDDLDPNCMILLFVESCRISKDGPSNFINYCRLGDKHWSSTLYGRSLGCCVPILLNDVLYVHESFDLDGGKLFRINDVNPNGIDKTEYCQVPQIRCSNVFDVSFPCQVVESCGELFYLCITTEGLSDQPISNVDVFKLDQVRMIWNRTRDVGDRVFIISSGLEYYISSWDAANDNQGGFLYYFNTHCFYSYSFADNCVSTYLYPSLWNIPKPVTSYYSPIHYLPDRRLTDRRAVRTNSVEAKQYNVNEKKLREEFDENTIMKNMKYEEESWFVCYPDDVIKSIARLLNPVDYLNFRLVSTTCRRLAPQSELREALIKLTFVAPPISPWFISSDNCSGVFKFVDSKLGGEYLMNIPEFLLDAKIHHTKNGWLLMSDESKKVLIFYNPFTKDIVKLPELDMRPNGSWSIIFSSSPTSTNCTVEAVHTFPGAFSVYIFQAEKKRWDSFHSYHSEAYSYFRPVFRGAACYVFRKQFGRLQALKVGYWRWTDLAIPFERDVIYSHKFVFEFNGKFMSIFIGDEGSSIKVFAEKRSMMRWEKVNNLEDRTVYVSNLSCFSTPARAEWMKNIIFLPRLHEKNIVYYSMTTGKYHALTNKDDNVVDFRNTRELLSAGWIEPSWSKFSDPF